MNFVKKMESAGEAYSKYYEYSREVHRKILLIRRSLDPQVASSRHVPVLYFVPLLLFLFLSPFLGDQFLKAPFAKRCTKCTKCSNSVLAQQSTLGVSLSCCTSCTSSTSLETKLKKGARSAISALAQQSTIGEYVCAATHRLLKLSLTSLATLVSFVFEYGCH